MSLMLTLPQARALMLATMGLLVPFPRPATKADVLATIRAMHILQIDTIQVVARSPYLVLWSRLGQYEPHWLDELLAEGQIFEYWSHEASFLPIDDYPFYRRMMLDGMARRWSYIRNWLAKHGEQTAVVLDHVRNHGPVRSVDFERTDGQKSGWWNWKFEKMALEVLYTTGDLMIARRERFQRVYDLRERVLPTWQDEQAPPLEAVLRRFVRSSVQALGVTPARYIADYFRLKQRETLKALAEVVAAGEVVPVTVEGMAEPWYIHNDRLALAESAARNELVPTLTTLLSPFDPLVWHRERALTLFGFDYRIECYTPAPKRRYGYFSLPILHRGQLVGRLDAKAHRAERRFEVKSLYLEPTVPPTVELATDLAAALHSCATWHRTPQVSLSFVDPSDFGDLLRSYL
jgi:uncharacterized protein